MELSSGLLGLFVSAFSSATILPGNSEIVFAAVAAEWPASIPAALAVATVGNTLGGLTTYLLGRFLPRKDFSPRLRWVERWGAATLLLSWVPVIGDGLCAAAGWLRVNVLAALVCMAIGKGARYAAIAALF